MSSKTVIKRVAWLTEEPPLTIIRTTVFISEQRVPESLEWDGLDETAIHLLATVDDKAVGCSRILSTGQIGRMAVLPAWRRRGIATLLLEKALKIISEESDRQPFLLAQTSVVSLYEKAGFKPVGEIFMDADIPHIRMEYSPDC